MSRIAILYHPATTAQFVEAWLQPLKAAAASFGVEAILAPINDSSELEPVIAAQAREPNGGLVAMPDSFLVGHRVEVTRWQLATIFLPSTTIAYLLKSAA